VGGQLFAYLESGRVIPHPKLVTTGHQCRSLGSLGGVHASGLQDEYEENGEQ